MAGKNYRKILAAAASAALLAWYAAPAASFMNVSAEVQILGETKFDYKAFPWHTCETSPARQLFEIGWDGTFHIMIVKAEGADREKWDLQFRHRKLDFKAGHTYEVSFDAKSSRPGFQLTSEIRNITGSDIYFMLDETEMTIGPSMGGDWGRAAELSEKWQHFKGIFKPTSDIKSAEWTFEYALGTQYEGNARDGDELWFDNMSIVCTTCDGECSTGPYSPDRTYLSNRDKAAEKAGFIPFISVNQLGYYSGLSKVAVLSDNFSELQYGGSRIDLTEEKYKFELCDSATGETVYTGVSGYGIKDKDSGDKVFKLDFTEYNTPGQYYIKAGEWRSFDFSIGDDIYSNGLLTDAVNFFYHNRSSSGIEAEYITSGDKNSLARDIPYKDRTAYVQTLWKDKYKEKDVSKYTSSSINTEGGWYDTENYNKYVINGGSAVWTLQNMYEMSLKNGSGVKFKDGSGTVVVPETGNDIPDILDEAAYELDWMTKMIVKEDEPTWGEYAGMVYHSVSDYIPAGVVDNNYYYDCEPVPQIVKPPTFAATLNFAACAAQAARLWAPYDSEKAADYLEKAKAAYDAYLKNYYEPDLKETEYSDGEYTYYTVKEAVNERSFYAPEGISAVPYSDYDVKDEAYWAACELYVSAAELKDEDSEKYYGEIKGYRDAFSIKTEITDSANDGVSRTSFNWSNTAASGSMTLALHADLLKEEDQETLKKSVTDAADTYINIEQMQGYGIPYSYRVEYNDPNSLDPKIHVSGYPYASNSMVVNNAVIMAYAYDQTGDSRYLSGVTTAMDYLLGTNPLAISYITGYGKYHTENPHHSYWLNELDDSYPKAPDGILVSGPNGGTQDPYIRLLGFVPACNNYEPSQRYYVDAFESWSTNNTDADINASLAWVVSFLQDRTGSADPDKGNSGNGTGTTDPDHPDKTEIIYGDIDQDAKVDLSDLTMLSQYNLKDIKLESFQLMAADCNGDGSVDITDIALLKQYVMNDRVVLGPAQ